MRKKETPNPSRVRGRGVEVSETLFYVIGLGGDAFLPNSTDLVPNSTSVLKVANHHDTVDL